MQGTKPLSPNPLLSNLSCSAAAELLHLWVLERVVLRRVDADALLQRMQDLDSAVADKYDALFVNEEDTWPSDDDDSPASACQGISRGDE